MGRPSFTGCPRPVLIEYPGSADFRIRIISPWQNGFAERLIGSIRRECVHHHCPGRGASGRILKSYAHYYNGVRTHRSLIKAAPASRSVQRAGVIRSNAILAGLHHHQSDLRFSVHTGRGSLALFDNLSYPFFPIALSVNRMKLDPVAAPGCKNEPSSFRLVIK
jgi:Integrase core domain